MPLLRGPDRAALGGASPMSDPGLARMPSVVKYDHFRKALRDFQHCAARGISLTAEEIAMILRERMISPEMLE